MPKGPGKFYCSFRKIGFETVRWPKPLSVVLQIVRDSALSLRVTFPPSHPE